MKVVMADKYWFLKGGAERYMFELAKRLEARGDIVVPFSMKDPRNLKTPYDKYFVSAVQTHEGLMGLEALRTAGRFLYSFEARTKMHALMRDVKPDVIHCHNIYHQLSPSFIGAAAHHGLPVVMTLHDYHLVSPNYVMFSQGKIAEPMPGHPYLDTVVRRLIRGSLAASALSAFEGWLHATLDLYKGVRTFIAPSRFLKDMCVKHGADPTRIEIVPHFIDLAGKQVVLSASNRVLFVGRLSEEKGCDVLLRAMTRLPDIRCSIVGDGPERTKLHRLAEDLHLNNVEFKGALYGEALEKEYQAARAVVIPSVCYEVFGLTALEAYAYGKPVIASRLGGLPEVVRDNQTGLLFPGGNPEVLAEKIGMLMGDEELCRRLGLAGRAVAEKEYAPEPHLKRIINSYTRQG